MKKLLDSTALFSYLAGILLLLIQPSCQCDKPDPDLPCPECKDHVEECVDGSCQCAEGYEKLWGQCTPISYDDPYDDPRGWGNKYLAVQGCFTFDSTMMEFPSVFFDYLSDTNTPHPVHDVTFLIQKIKYFGEFDEYNMQEQNGYTYFNAAGDRVIKFQRGEWNDHDIYPDRPIFGDSYPGYDIDSILTDWYGVFSEDKEWLDFQVYLKVDTDHNGIYETIVDSCQMQYRRW